TPEQEAEIEAAIADLTGRFQLTSAGLPPGVVMSALLTCVLTGAAGTPHARLIVLEHLQAAARSVQAMGTLHPDAAMEAAGAANPSLFVKAEAEAIPPGTTIQ
ncbi:MAG TPA: hypothetical protein VIL30_02595, partial [Ramlibacter sp.]